MLREMVRIYSELSGLATQDADVASVLHLVAIRIGVTATVVDSDLRVVAAAPGDTVVEALHALRPTDGALARLVAATARMRRAVSASTEESSVIVAPILLGDEPAAYLVTIAGPEQIDDDDPAESMRLMVTEHAAMVCGIMLGRARVVAAAAGQARRDLFEGLLSLSDRPDAEIEGWARHLGIKPDQAHRVLVVALDAESADPATQSARASDAAALVEHLLSTRSHEATVINRGNEVVAVIEEAEAGPTSLSAIRTVAQMCENAIQSRYPGVTVSVGIGSCYPGAARINRSYTEARRANDAAKLMTRLGSVVVFAELGIHRLLARVPDLADLRAFADEVLGDLVRHERANSTPYLTTLTVYFNENGSPQRTARRLHMHPNTVAYRVRRIEEIVGLSLSSYTDRLVIQVALEILNGLGDSA